MIKLLYHIAIKDEKIPNPNNENWRRYVIKELRDNVLHKLDGLERNYKDIGILLYFNELGTYFAVFRQISLSQGRPNDHHVIWVFIPQEDKVATHDLQHLLDVVIDRIKSNHPSNKQEQALLSEDVERLGQNIPFEVENRPAFVSANNGKYACRYYCNEENTLHEIIEAGLFQQDYKNYEAVFLLDRNEGLKCKLGVDDLTNKEFTQNVIVDPEQLFDVPLPKGVELYYKDKPFKKPEFVTCGESLPISFKREGRDGAVYLPITGTVKVGNKIQLPKFDWKVRIRRDLFKVRNKDKVIKDFNLIINNRLVQGDYIDITEEEAKKARVKIGKNGYTQISDEGDVDLLEALRRGQIVIELRKDDQEFVVSQGDFEKVCVVVTTSQTIDNDQSPLDGYVRRGNMLEYKSWAFLKYLPFWFMMAGALILGGVGGYFISNWLNPRNAKQNTEVNNPGTPVQNGQNLQQLSPSDGSTSTGTTGTAITPEKPVQNAAVEYLDNNDVWKKDEMDQIAELKGFWDLVNYYDIDRIKKQPWKDRLSESKTYNEIINTFGNKITSDFRTNKPHNKRTDDYDINVERYINAIKGYSGNSNAQPQAGSSTPKKEHPTTTTTTTTTTTNSTNNQSTNQSAGTNEENL